MRTVSPAPPSVNPTDTNQVCWTHPTKRQTRHEMGALLESIQEILAGEEGQITIRHLFYRLVGLGVIEKTERAYKALCHHLATWRRSGDIQWDAFADNTRWHIRRPTFNDVDDALVTTAEGYRKNLWASQPCYVETWVEKDAIAGIVSGTANSFGVPVFVCRGFASLSSMYDAAQTFRRAQEAGKSVVIYHLGDYDPSGVAAGRAIINSFRDDFGLDVDIERAAVTPEQIAAMNLPTRPTKESSHSSGWEGGSSVELDSMPPAEIRAIVERCITQHIDTHQWQAGLAIEAQERETLRRIACNWGGPHA